jgi:DNA-directed RNA polymerase subunit beta'
MDYFDTRRPEVNTEEEWIKDVPVSARYSSMQEAYKAYENKEIHIKDKIMILHNGEAIETTVGRVIFNMKMPEGLPYINKNMKSKDIKQLLGQVFDEYGMPVTVRLSDDIKDL